jgi:hypothetical protein
MRSDQAAAPHARTVLLLVERQFSLCAAAGLASVIWFELYKLLRRHTHA